LPPVRTISIKSPGRLVGYAAVWDSYGKDKDGGAVVIKPGAFSSALRSGENIRALIGHNPKRYLGSTWDRTLRLVEDGFGLYAEILLPASPFGSVIGPWIKSGVCRGMSFYSAAEEWHYQDGMRVITGMRRILDVGPCVLPPSFADTLVFFRPGYGGSVR
jgi:HK97 family phage prohead protease